MSPCTIERPVTRIHRRAADHTQQLRQFVQCGFVALNVWIGVDFYLWVRQYEMGEAIVRDRPPGVDGWLPIAGLLNLRVFLATGQVWPIHPAAMVLMIAFAAMSLVLRRSFCSWLCPVGTLSEQLWRLGRRTFHRNWTLPRWLDIALRSVKYLLLAFFVFAVATMSVGTVQAFLQSPYGVLADVKMLDLFRFLSVTSAVVLGLLIFASILVKNFWCRYGCPYGALMGLIALASPLRIRRDKATCIDCGKCARACPAQLSVDRLVQIRSAECLGCMECVASCPVEGALDLRAFSRRRVPAAWVAAGAVAIFLGTVALAQATGHWHSAIPAQVYREWMPFARELSH
ncbi:MAG TPA: 4Fe-4S binding protein [Bryobacteraceae bacterium]|nr:4Fe-4S binding protein [Bryobacteraceae bacterium]